MNRLFILSKKKEIYQRLLLSQLPEKLVITNEINEAHIILGEPPMVKDRLNNATQLHWFQSVNTGVEPMIHAPSATDYQLTNIREGMGPLISEYVIGYCLSHFRHLLRYYNLQQQQLWQPFPYQSLAQKKMLIIGTGAIGQHLAKTATVFGLRCFGLNKMGQQVADFELCEPFNNNSQLIPQADIIVTALPLTQETYHIIDDSFFTKAQDAIFFNIGRGATICEKSLLKSLEQKQIQQAYLDVFEQEPLPPNHPFWTNPKVIITPHIAAKSRPESILPVFLDNYQRYLTKQPLKYLVNKIQGY